MHNSINFLLVGVGGQGILTASDIVAEVGLAIGLDAKKSEVHGLARSPLGATSPPGAMSLQAEVAPAEWLVVIVRRVPPRYVELNRMAFWEGRKKLPVRS
ncbi:MAG: hypothetical protein P8186_11760 [Anaerolineae bacterium]